MVINNIVFTIVFVIGVMHISSIQADDPMMVKIEKVFKSCRERHNIQISFLENAVKNRKLPQDENGKKFIRCIMMAIGFNELKNIIRRGNSPKGNYAGLIQLPEFEKELDDLSAFSGIL